MRAVPPLRVRLGVDREGPVMVVDGRYIWSSPFAKLMVAAEPAVHETENWLGDPARENGAVVCAPAPTLSVTVVAGKVLAMEQVGLPVTPLTV